MKFKHVMMGLACVAAWGFTASLIAGEEKAEAVTLDQVPQKVKDTLAKYATPAEVKKIEKGEDDDQAVYEFDIEQGSHKFEVSITPKGKFWGLEEDVELTALPDAARQTLTAEAVGGKLTGTEKAEDKDHKITYEGVIEKDGKKIEVAVDAAGKVVSTEKVSEEKKD